MIGARIELMPGGAKDWLDSVTEQNDIVSLVWI
jgi:hypothetical protein